MIELNHFNYQDFVHIFEHRLRANTEPPSLVSRNPKDSSLVLLACLWLTLELNCLRLLTGGKRES